MIHRIDACGEIKRQEWKPLSFWMTSDQSSRWTAERKIIFETQPKIQRDAKLCFVLACSTELPDAFVSVASGI